MTDGWRIAAAGALAFVVVSGLVPLCRRFALAHDITDRPAPGKVHRRPTPYLGGVAICVAAVASSIVLPGWQRDAIAIVAAACLVSVAGLVDDIRGLGALARLAIEIPAASLAVAAGARAELFGNPADFVISVAFLVVVTNAFNLLDNMDGAAGAIGTTIAIALATTALVEQQTLVGGLAVVVAATCLGFLLYNWNPAAIFMGDAGSLFLGFLLAVIALTLRTRVEHEASALAVLLLLGPALFDTTLVVISRARARRPIYIGGTDHTSHRLVLLGLSPVGATVTLVAATASCAGLGVLVAQGLVAPSVTAPFVALGAVLGLALMLRVGVYKEERGRCELTRAGSTLRHHSSREGAGAWRHLLAREHAQKQAAQPTGASGDTPVRLGALPWTGRVVEAQAVESPPPTATRVPSTARRSRSAVGTSRRTPAR